MQTSAFVMKTTEKGLLLSLDGNETGGFWIARSHCTFQNGFELGELAPVEISDWAAKQHRQLVGDARYEENKVAKANVAKPPGDPILAAAKAAFDGWPADDEFQPRSVEELRDYLLCKAGWCTTHDLTLPTDQSMLGRTLTAFLNAHATGASNVFFRSGGQKLRAFRPKPLALTDTSEVLSKVRAVLMAAPSVRAALPCRGGARRAMHSGRRS